MPDREIPRIAVVGAAGFVGREVLRQFQERGVSVTAIVRGFPELSVDGGFHRAQHPSDAGEPPFDLVINLAYPTSGPEFLFPDQDATIARTVERLTNGGGRLIHVSTLAVFGMAVDRPVHAARVESVRDSAYVESKITAEHTYERMQQARGSALDIVRLGNVWGAGSGAWALPVVQRLITGRPVGVHGAPGYSNTTDVVNVASYLIHLALDNARRTGVRYHHVAEFAEVPWPEWVEPIATQLGVDPVSVPLGAVERPTTARSEIAAAFDSVSPRQVYMKLARERITGSRARSLIRRLPPRLQERMRSGLVVVAAAPEMSRDEQTFLSIMAGNHPFHSVVDETWVPRLSKDQSLDAVLAWLLRG